MEHMDLERIAADLDLVVEKSDFGRYGQWKDAQVDLYMPGDKSAGRLASGVQPPVENYAPYPSIENVRIPSGITTHNGNPEFTGW